MESIYFFSKYKDFKSKDYDDLCIMDTFIFPGCVMNTKNPENKKKGDFNQSPFSILLQCV